MTGASSSPDGEPGASEATQPQGSDPTKPQVSEAAEAEGSEPAEADGSKAAEPDARFTFANERTFLAWSRTALALVIAGLGVVQLLPPFAGVPWGRDLIGLPLIALGGIVVMAGYVEWVRHQRALRRGKPIPPSILPVVLTVTVASVAAVSAAVLLLSATR